MQQLERWQPSELPVKDELLEYSVESARCDFDARVAVIMAVYNGERFLDEQIASIANQTVRHIDIWASDDGSLLDTSSKMSEMS